MTETYLQLTQQIEELKQRAATIKEQEVAEVVERIRIAIAAYGLTSAQLFGGKVSTTPGRPAGKKAARRGGKKASGARYMDGAGNSWSGRGPRPRWIKAALAAGQSIDQFALAPSEGAADKSGGGGPAKSKAGSAPKYKDETGNVWSGRGPRPRWFKAALAAGKTPEQFAV